MGEELYSVRMRASLHGRHLTGAERIVAAAEAEGVVAAMTGRALRCPGGSAAEIECRLERIAPEELRYGRLPDLRTYRVDGWREGRAAAVRLLTRAGVPAVVAASAVELLGAGAGPGGTVMRGAVIMDVATGERLEADPARGVRATRMDVAASLRTGLEHALAAAGLGHHRVSEALVLAGKVLLAPGMVAELCWSDDPAYTVGYVAEPEAGYQRITALKPVGDRRGGRVFFVDGQRVSLAELVDFLERRPVLFDGAGVIVPPVAWRDADE